MGPGPVHPDQIKIDARLDAIEQGYSDEDGIKVVAGRIGTKRRTAVAFDHDTDNPTHLDLRRFAEWRVSKCPPRDYGSPGDRRADLCQATLELAGEAGEVAEVILRVGDEAADLHDPALRDKLLDEIGDVLFCASWLADAWGLNPLRRVAKMTAALQMIQIEKRDRTLTMLVRLGLLLSGQVGLLSNSAKKLLCQDREQPVDIQYGRLCSVFDYSAMILSVVEVDVCVAAAKVIAKLDARFPTGIEVRGGGIRTGEGA